jgi:hypothetical protein
MSASTRPTTARNGIRFDAMQRRSPLLRTRIFRISQREASEIPDVCLRAAGF